MSWQPEFNNQDPCKGGQPTTQSCPLLFTHVTHMVHVVTHACLTHNSNVVRYKELQTILFTLSYWGREE